MNIIDQQQQLQQQQEQQQQQQLQEQLQISLNNQKQQHQEQLDNVLQENYELQQALKKTKGSLERTLSDYRSLQGIHDSFKLQWREILNQKEELQQKINTMQQDQRQQQMEHQQDLRQLQEQLEEKQLEIDDLETKMIKTQDYGLQRLKIVQELEIPHKLELEKKDYEIQQMEDKMFQLRRESEMLKVQLENMQDENQKQIKELQTKHQIALKDQELELMTKPQIKQQKRNRDYEKELQYSNEQLKAEISSLESQVKKLRSDIQLEKQDKSRQLERIYKDIENDKLQMRRLQTENEKFQDTIEHLEDELKDNIEKNIKLQQKLNSSQHNTPGKLNQTEGSIADGKMQFIESDVNIIKQKENYQKIQQKRIQTLQEQLNEAHDLRKQKQKSLEEQIDRLKEEKRNLDEEFRLGRDQMQNLLRDEKKKNSTLVEDKKNLEQELEEALSQNQELKQNILKIGGNKSFLMQGGELQDVSLISNKAMINQSKAFEDNYLQPIQPSTSILFNPNQSKLVESKLEDNKSVKFQQQQLGENGKKQQQNILVQEDFGTSKQNTNNISSNQNNNQLQKQLQTQQQLIKKLFKQLKNTSSDSSFNIDNTGKNQFDSTNVNADQILSQFQQKQVNDNPNISYAYQSQTQGFPARPQNTMHIIDQSSQQQQQIQQQYNSQIPAQDISYMQKLPQNQINSTNINNTTLNLQHLQPQLIQQQNMLQNQQQLQQQQLNFSVGSDQSLMDELNQHRQRLQQLSNDIESAYNNTYSVNHLQDVQINQQLLQKDQQQYPQPIKL